MFSLMESALDAVGAEDSLLDEAQLAIREADLHRRTGRVVDLIGLITEATGLDAEVGEVCVIETGRGRATVPAEVVGFRDGRTLLMPLGEPKGIGPGSKVVATGQPLKVDVSDALLGRALDGLGNPLDGKGPIDHTHWYPAEQAPPDPLSRPRIHERVSLGVRSLDAFVPCGRGQRIGIFAGSGVGKSSLAGHDRPRHVRGDQRDLPGRRARSRGARVHAARPRRGGPRALASWSAPRPTSPRWSA